MNLKGIVTDIFPLDEAQKAMDYSVNNKADIVKAVIQINPDAGSVDHISRKRQFICESYWCKEKRI